MKKIILLFICFTAIFSTYSCTAEAADTTKPNAQQTTIDTGDDSRDKAHS